MPLDSIKDVVLDVVKDTHHCHISSSSLQRSVTGVLNGTIKEWGVKETHTMVSIIGLLASELEAESQQVRRTLMQTGENAPP